VLGPFSTLPDERLKKHQKLPVRVRLQLFALSLWLWSVFNTATPGSNCDVCSNYAVFDDAFDGRCPHQFLLQSPQIWFEKHQV